MLRGSMSAWFLHDARIARLSGTGLLMNVAKAGTAYVLIVFAVGFALGAIRVTFIAPATGPLAAVFIELPFMLTAAWFIAGWLIRTLEVPATVSARAIMGLVAFALLMVIETLAGSAFGRSLASQLSELQQPAGIAGLIGQILFALIPLLLLRAKQKS